MSRAAPMGDALHGDRPAKRIKLEPQQQQQHHHQQLHQHHQYVAAPPLGDVNAMAAAGHAHAHGLADPWAAISSPMFDNAWKWPGPPHSNAAHSPAMLVASPGPDVLNGGWTAVPGPASVAPVLQFAAPSADFGLSPTSTTNIHPPTRFDNQSRFPRLLPAIPGEDAPPSPPQPQDQRRRKTRLKQGLVSPFRDCVDTFGLDTTPPFARPKNGQVNGYVKFNWPQKSKSEHRNASVSIVTDVTDAAEAANDSRAHEASQLSTVSQVSSSAVVLGSSSGMSSASYSPSTMEEQNIHFAIDQFLRSPGPVDMTSVRSSLSPTPTQASLELVIQGGPQPLPRHFGLNARADSMDRKLWTFYVNNWCPGRSVLRGTNLWLKDFAQMEESDGVRAAIHSLAGIYIYDYQPTDAIRKRVNERFSQAESRLGRLLSDPTALSKSQAGELITIASILSMQDIVLTERRLKKPFNPRWLQGFKQAEHILHMFDEGARFWKTSNIQLPSLQTSQAIIVGRAVILAQPMTALPQPAHFDPEMEASRFGWLLYGSQQDMYEIHGGCGFSKKLLHVISQITYCAARLQQDRESPIVPLTARYLFDVLVEMRQWSNEARHWDAVRSGPPVIDHVRSLPGDHMINTSVEMTDVTAETWRFAAILYLQCRVMRLPRNDPGVVNNLADLAACIRIMPTSGEHFTAQAPLFPVFLLGLLATVPEHKAVANTWFSQVLQTPVRSSVPPLYNALQRIWAWLDTEIELSPPGSKELPDSIGMRRPWWERLVARVHEKEKETLCLT